MDLDQLNNVSIFLIHTYSSQTRSLREFEVLAYEQACRLQYNTLRIYNNELEDRYETEGDKG